MKQNITIRKRKSAKHGVTYEYRFEIAPMGGQRKWISKGGYYYIKNSKTYRRRRRVKSALSFVLHV